MIRRLLFLFSMICCTCGAFAQETTSQILGTVSDGSTGLSGATVIALHTPTGTKYTTTTRKDGRFNLPNVRVGGPYIITVSYVGFKEDKQENITLTVGQDFVSDVKMTPESKELTAVNVSATRQNKTFNNNRTGAQEIITRQQIERLPTISRSIQDFAKLEPSSNGLSFAGSNPGMNNITVDGADFNNSFGLSNTLGGQANAQPIALDAIDQIQVNVAPYDVRQGGFTGAGVNSVTRSGTNQFRATIYDYKKGPGTIGYNVENTKVPRTDFSYNVVGASLGGAIIKNKLFFFVNAEQNKQSQPATGIQASDASHAPQAGVYSVANADTLNKIAALLKSKYNYDPGSFAPATFQTNSYKINARLDFNINSNNTLSLKYNYLKSYSDQYPSNSRPGAGQVTLGQPSNLAIPFSGAGYRINNNLNIYIAELNTRFGNSASNKLQVGYTRERDFRSAKSSSATFPHVDILNSGVNYTSFGYEMYTYNNVLNMDSYQLTDIFSLYKGAHEITIGSQNSYKKYANAFAPGWNGVYQFNSLSDFFNGAPAATYYQQYSTLKGAAFPWAYAGATNLSFFAQDKYRVTPTFTLTYGVRFDYTSYQNKFTDNPNFDALKFKDGASYNVGKAPGTFLVISPRVGFNWDITGDRTWQLRGGAGIFEGAPPFVWIENQAANNGVQFGSFTAKNFPFYADPAQALDHYLTTQTPPLAQTSTPTGYSTAVVASNFKYPTKLRTSVGLDKKLPNDWVLTGEFTYSKDIHATYMANVNLNETNAFAITNGGDNRLRYNTSNVTSGTNNSNKYYNGTTLTNPNIGNAIVLFNTSKGFSYNATARIQKSWTNLTASVAYSYSETKSAMETGSTASSLWAARPVANTDPNAPTLARPSWYQPHRIIAYATYHINEGKHTATYISAVYEATTAGANSYVYNGDLNGDGNTSNDLIYIPKAISDITLVPVNGGSATSGVGSLDHSDTRTAAQMWSQLNAFIGQDHYLNKHRGQYAQANSTLNPWYKHLDLNFAQDIYFYTKNGSDKDKHTLRLSMDIVNIGNLFNKYWGLLKSPSQLQILKFEGMAADGKTPQFSFPYADAPNKVPYVNSYNNNTSLTNFANGQTFYGSRWQIQFGIRYMFN